MLNSKIHYTISRESKPGKMGEVAMRTKKLRQTNFLITILRYTYGAYLRLVYNFKISGYEQIEDLQPPYIVISNHVNTVDPMIISMAHKRHIHWVAGDHLFRNPYLRFLLRRFAGSISKSKSRSDYATIQQITRTIKRGKIVGLFPEGRRTWDGRTVSLFFSTAKLIRMLKVPVVICILEGGYQTLPRWSAKKRRGVVTVAYQKPLLPQEFAGMKADEIHALLTERLAHNAYDYQEKHKIIFRSNRRAEYLEHVLYICPVCGSLAALESQGNNYRCKVCNLEVTVDTFGLFQSNHPDFSFKHVADWNIWQRQKLRERIALGEWSNGKSFFPGDTGVRFFTGYRDSSMNYHGFVEINLYQDRIEIQVPCGGSNPVDGTRKRIGKPDKEDTSKPVTGIFDVNLFPLDHIESLSINMQRNLEFYFKGVLYHLKFPKPRGSAYKYLSVYEAIIESQNEEKQTTAN